MSSRVRLFRNSRFMLVFYYYSACCCCSFFFYFWKNLSIKTRVDCDSVILVTDINSARALVSVNKVRYVVGCFPFLLYRRAKSQSMKTRTSWTPTALPARSIKRHRNKTTQQSLVKNKKEKKKKRKEIETKTSRKRCVLVCVCVSLRYIAAIFFQEMRWIVGVCVMRRSGHPAEKTRNYFSPALFSSYIYIFVFFFLCLLLYRPSLFFFSLFFLFLFCLVCWLRCRLYNEPCVSSCIVMATGSGCRCDLPVTKRPVLRKV